MNLRILLLAGAVVLCAADQPSHKVLVCHIPPGNPANMHTISIDQSGLAAHLGHGDPFGACTSGSPI